MHRTPREHRLSSLRDPDFAAKVGSFRKSTLLQQVFPDYAYLTLDDPLVLQQALHDPELLLESAGPLVVIDEIQYAPSLLPPYHNNLGKRITKAPKVYFLDAGLVCYLTGLRDQAHLLQGPMVGSLFENFCVQETLKAFAARGESPRLFFLRTKTGLEVDLLIEGLGPRLYPFEPTLAATPRVEMAEPIRQFRQQFAALKPEPGAVMSLATTSRPLSADARLLSFSNFLTEAVNKGVSS